MNKKALLPLIGLFLLVTGIVLPDLPMHKSAKVEHPFPSSIKTH